MGLLGNRISDWVLDQAERFGDRFAEYWGRLTGKAVKGAAEALDPDLMVLLEKTIQHLMDQTYSLSAREIAKSPKVSSANIGPIPTSVEEIIPSIGDAEVRLLTPIWSVLGSPGGMLPFIGDIGEGGMGVICQQTAAHFFRPTLLSPQDAVKLLWRVPDKEDLAKNDLAYQGFASKRIDQLFDLYRPLIDPDHVRQLVLRGEDPEGNILAELKKAGWTDERIEAIKKLWEIIPPIQDIIRMAVREAFTPEIAEEFGQYQDFPEDFLKWAKTQGLSEDWAKAYWAAHWNLPSTGQAFEMFQRTVTDPTSFSGEAAGKVGEKPYYRVIDEEHLNLLLRALDIMPAWRDKLTKIAYQPLTRVDVRRMYGLNVLDRDGVKRAYLDLGYNDENAERMTEFTIKYQTQQDKDLTKAEILKAYRRKTISPDDTMELLQELGYSEDEADFLMQTEDVSAAAAERDLSEAKLKTLYLTELMPKLEVTANLTGLGYDATEIEYLYKLWDLEKGASVQMPTRSELTHFLGIGILDEDEFGQQMVQIGYPEQHIGWYVEEFRADQAEAARKEEERAQAEADRVAKAEKSSKYEQDRAKIDVDIAQARVYIADAQVSLLEIGTADEQAKLRSIAARQKQALARLSLDQRQQIAQLSLELRIAARGATDEDKAVLERAALEERQAIESLSIQERENVASLALEESEKVRREVSDRLTELQVGIAGARADIAALQLDKAQLKLTYVE